MITPFVIHCPPVLPLSAHIQTGTDGHSVGCTGDNLSRFISVPLTASPPAGDLPPPTDVTAARDSATPVRFPERATRLSPGCPQIPYQPVAGSSDVSSAFLTEGDSWHLQMWIPQVQNTWSDKVVFPGQMLPLSAREVSVRCVVLQDEEIHYSQTINHYMIEVTIDTCFIVDRFILLTARQPRGEVGLRCLNGVFAG